MHRYLVVSMTFRGKYSVVGFVHKSQAEAYLQTVVAEPHTYDARVIDLD